MSGFHRYALFLKDRKAIDHSTASFLFQIKPNICTKIHFLKTNFLYIAV